MRRFQAIVSAAAAALTLLACDGDSGPTGGNGNGDGNGTGAAPTSIAEVSGDAQRGLPGSTLEALLVVKVSDAQGNGVSGVTVAWSVTAGGGTLSATSSTTSSTGDASVGLTLGSSEGQNAVTATVAGLTGSPVTFTAAAVLPAAVAPVSGGGQTARISQPLASPLVVEVTASDGLGVPGVDVSWAVAAGGGTVAANTTTTDSNGQASVVLTLGPTVGPNAATGSVSGLTGSPVLFAASGTQPVLITVEMLNTAFVAPGGGDAITIMLGDTVQWLNRDAVQHTASSTTTPSGGTSFNSGFLNNGQTFRTVPDVRGTWVYLCMVHPTLMNGARITVN